MKKLKSLLCIVLAASLVFSSVAISAFAKSDSDGSYPYVFVHGLNGWGAGEGINNTIPYWGATTGDLCEFLAAEGYETYSASVGPLSSAWDRACELYAQLTGTTVDYGAAHSLAEGHSRYGRTYDEPLFDDWGQPDQNGKIKKINLIGHSFGGTTIRMMTYLLCNGSETELNNTAADDISGLFTGDKDEWVNSITAIATPHNSSTTYTLFDKLNLLTTLKVVCYSYAGLAGRSLFNGYVDFHLEQFGLTNVPGSNNAADYRKTVRYLITECEDAAQYDLEPAGANRINDFIDISDNVYYFSYPFCTTFELSRLGISVPIPSTNPVLMLTAGAMGLLSKSEYEEFPYDESWRASDGLVNTISATYPFDEPHKEFNYGQPVSTGIWNVFPAQRGDHGTAIGLLADKGETRDFYLRLFNMLEALPKTEG